MNSKHFSTIGAIISWFALIGQFYLSIENRITSTPETVIRFFSYFTVLTNLIVAFYFTSNLLSPESKLRQFFQKAGVLTAVAVYITVVGLTYQILLRDVWKPEGFQLIINELLHSFIPLEFIIYWFLFENKKSLEWKFTLPWTIYPFVYAVYVFIRGSFSGFYPYFFIDVSKLGYQAVFLNTIGLFVVFMIFSALYIAIAKALKK